MPVDVSVQTKIDASASDVWRVISDFSVWNEWHKSDVQVDIQDGIPKCLNTEMSGFKLRIGLRDYRSIENERLEWVGSLPFSGFLLSGHRVFTILPDEEGSCTLLQEETFYGFCTLFLRRKLIKSYSTRYAHHNLAIKKIAELNSTEQMTDVCP